MPGRFRAAFALGVVVLLLTLGWAGSASAKGSDALFHPTAAGGVEWLNVTVSDSLAFGVPPPSEVQPGDLVHVVVTQLGSVDHTFTLSSVAGYQFPSTASAGTLTSFFQSHPPLVNINISAGVGNRAYGNFTAPPYGEYEFVCLKPGHFQAGMSGILGSGEAGATTSVNNGPGAPVFIISGVIVSLVILALVLGFVVGKRRGASDEMPPERLGYPETPDSTRLP